MKYDFIAIERKWQDHWQAHGTFRTPNPGEQGFDPAKPKFYVLDMFPYPSGVGLHVGHPLGYIATDIVGRYRRMKGDAVLHPMGYDAFGLPAEQFAVEHGVHPRITTEQNIANMTRQLRRLGLGYDWDRCVATTDPQYYRWTQWIFLQMYHSWFDTDQRKARPIVELVQKLESERLCVDVSGDLVDGPTARIDAIAGAPVGMRKWHELSSPERDGVLSRQRLAFIDEVPVNWCPALGTVLANEEVTSEGLSERGNHRVYKRPLRQWMLRITAYANRLLEELEWVDWPEPIKLMQRNWIGRSEGADVDFPLATPASGNVAESALADGSVSDDLDQGTVRVFTTRPDTLFGATYMVFAPEHPLVKFITTAEHRDEVRQYCEQAASTSDVDRQVETKGKTGVFTGAFAINPVNNARIPIWIADYVLMGYGSGAIMAVPAHDQRDFEFAQTFDLPIRAVIMPPDAWLKDRAKPINELGPLSVDDLRARYLEQPVQFAQAFSSDGTNVNSANSDIALDGLATSDAKATMTAWLEKRQLGAAQVQYRLRDWLFSRQRYWGEPIPVLHGPDGEIVAVDESDLPVLLPELEDFTPHSSDDPNAPVQTPLSRAPEAWKCVHKNGKRYTRELNTMPQWAGSCWYYLRYLDPNNDDALVQPETEQYWMAGQDGPGLNSTGGVDLYVGGAEHAVLHLLYARFWHKVLYDLGHISSAEPFGRLFNQGYIQAHAYTDHRGVHVSAEQVEEKAGQYFYENDRVKQQLGKMGKSLKNAVNPDEICEQYGCDTLRLYEMYLGPLDQSKLWNTRDIIGVHRFLQRLWRNFIDVESGQLLVSDDPPNPELRKQLHRTIKRVTDDMERMNFNTAIAALIELNNALVGLDKITREVAEAMVLLLAPLAPHIGEELWALLGHEPSVADVAWPNYDESLLSESTVEYPIQVNGKVRGRITVSTDADQKSVEQTALADEAVQRAVAGKAVHKVIVVPGRMVNVVVK